MSKILISRSDGGLSILSPRPGLDPAHAVARWSATMAATGAPYTATSWRVVDKVGIGSSDRSFRNAWVDAAGSVIVDMPKARAIHMGRIRVARDERLKQLDVDYIRADEAGDAAGKAAIALEKTRLRDIPDTFDLSVATTPEQLNALWPSGL